MSTEDWIHKLDTFTLKGYYSVVNELPLYFTVRMNLRKKNESQKILLGKKWVVGDHMWYGIIFIELISKTNILFKHEYVTKLYYKGFRKRTEQ